MTTALRRRWYVVAAATVAAVVFGVLLALASCGESAPETVTVVAAGDMACDPTDPSFGDGTGKGDECQRQAVSDQAVALEPYAVLGLGDYQYEVPTAEAYQSE